MARLPDILGSLGPDAQKVHDRISAKRGRVGGPYAPLMHHPPLAERMADLGEYLPFEWVSHAVIARKEGVPEEIIETIRARRDLSTLPARYVRAARLVQHVLARESVPAALQAEVEQEVGVPGMVELVVLAGYYQAIAAVLFAFDAPLPPGTSGPF